MSNVTSFALRPVSTPGNGTVYGTEFDSDLGYSSGHIFAGISYGVLFPFARRHLREFLRDARSRGDADVTDAVVRLELE